MWPQVSTTTEFSPALPQSKRNASEAMRQSAAVFESTLPTGAIAHIEVFRDPAGVEAAWAELESAAAVSAYQTRAFLIPWLESLGKSRGVEPLFVLGRDWKNRPVAFFPLGIEYHGPIRAAVFLGGKESNFNLGLIRPDVALTASDLRILFGAVVRALGKEAPHLFVLRNQPREWDGVPNPLALLPHQKSPSFAYATKLEAGGKAFVAGKLSKDSRKKLRKKETRLAEIGPVTLMTNDTTANARALVDVFLAEKIARCEERAYEADFADPAMRCFLERLSVSRDDRPPALNFYGLKAGERIVATYAGFAHRNHFSCLINSFESDPEIAKSSPGDLLLMRLVALQCDAGRSGLDLGIGEARYKSAYCELTLPLFDVVLPVGPIGHLFAATTRLRLSMKRWIKHKPEIFASVRRLRQIVPGLALL
jgi:CelD/BcsL family acetyltransferase involved in cellulose biosynthesis